MNYKFFNFFGEAPKSMAMNYFIKMGAFISGTTTVDDPETEDVDESEEVLIVTPAIKEYRDKHVAKAFKAYLKTLEVTGVLDLSKRIVEIRKELIWCYNGCVSMQDASQYDDDLETLGGTLADILKNYTNFSQGGMASIIENSTLLYSALLKIKKADRVKLKIDKFTTMFKSLTSEYVKVEKQRKKQEDANKGSIKTAKDAYCDIQEGYLSMIEAEHIANKSEKSLVNGTQKFLKSLTNAIKRTKQAKRDEKAKKAEEAKKNSSK